MAYRQTLDMKGWITLCSDLSWEDYHGMWCRRAPDGSYLVIQWTNMVDACGSECEDSPYLAEVRRVDLPNVPADRIKSALDCVGLDLADWPGDRDLAIVESLIQYGASEPLDSFSGRSYPLRVRAQARRAAEAYLQDAGALDRALDRPVNAIGSTAREYGAGDFTSAMRRGCESGDPKARLMARMHGAPQDAIDDTRPVDFLPYAMGYMRALAGAEPDASDPDDPIAPEYFRGYDRGRRVRAGECPAPSWIQTVDVR